MCNGVMCNGIVLSCISLMAYDMDWEDEANEGPGKRGTQMVRTQLEEL